MIERIKLALIQVYIVFQSHQFIGLAVFVVLFRQIYKRNRAGDLLILLH